MKTYLKSTIYFALAILLYTSCSSDDDKVYCAMINVPIKINLNYYDENGNDLIFGTDPVFLRDSVSFFTVSGGQSQELTHTIVNDEPGYFNVNIPQGADGTFFIELAKNLTDTIRYKASQDMNDPCRAYKVDSLFQNEADVIFNEQTQIWQLIK